MLKLVLIVFITGLLISTTILMLGNFRNKEFVEFLNLIVQSNKRVNLVGSNILIMRSILNIANGYESLSNSISTDRFNLYKSI